MAQTTIETPPSLPDVLVQNITSIKKGEYELDLPSSFSFGPRIFGGLVISITHQAVQKYFTETHHEYNQPDILSMDVHLGKSPSTILVTVSQKGKECMMGFMKPNQTNPDPPSPLASQTSPTPKSIPSPSRRPCTPPPTNTHPPPHNHPLPALNLLPNPPPLLLLPKHTLPSQILHPPSPISAINSLPPPTPPQPPQTKPSASSSTSPFPSSITFTRKSVERTGCNGASRTRTEQKREREMGVSKIVDAESGSYRAPAMITSLAASIEMKKLLPPGGAKWLFMRAQAKEIKDGRLSMEVMVFNEGMGLVAFSQQLCPK